MKKICSKCKVTKPVEDFHKLHKGKMGKHSNCKVCRTNYQKTLIYEKPIKGK